MKFSVNMVTRDRDERLFQRAIESVSPYAVEILVREDTGKEKKSRVDILNQLKKESRGDWILRIDDDEVWPRETMEEILALNGSVPVYSIPFLHYENGGFINPRCHSEKRPGFFVVRLFRNLSEMKWVWKEKEDWDVLKYGSEFVSSRGFQTHLCNKISNPFLHLGELRQGKREHEYHYHERGHCWMPLGKYAPYLEGLL